MKYNFREARYVLERASARETTARVAVGAVAKIFLKEFGIEVASHVIAVGQAAVEREDIPFEEVLALRDREEIILDCVDTLAEARMKEEVDRALEKRDTVGGTFEVIARGLPPGLGSCAQWDERLDGHLAQAVMSIQAVKAVEIGSGIESAAALGSRVHDEIGYDRERSRFTRKTNRAGGMEGGITNGEDLVVRGYLKPISTLRRPLESVDFETKETVKAAYERSDVCVLPAARRGRRGDGRLSSWRAPSWKNLAAIRWKRRGGILMGIWNKSGGSSSKLETRKSARIRVCVTPSFEFRFSL